MSHIFSEVLDELKKVLSGRTLDTVIVPTLFAVANSILGLNIAIAISLFVGLCLLAIRLYKKENSIYAILSLLGLVMAGGLAYLNGSAADFYLQDIISGVIFTALALLSIAIKKPMAAWTSHLLRGWEWQWFKRKDIMPAYVMVTIIWAIFFALRLILFIWAYRAGNETILYITNILTGIPALIIVLIISYLFGLKQLEKLSGPSIDEFRSGQEPPWLGQRKGF